ncbi:carboxymuconolactone decarboxylase family protein [Burkholderia multivorans]|jgi:4-carboxymuconolactone decarboxylase|uniref:4-carboxymuconolactone decarboxylase n=1 Tax=Burkholderia multivorans CGD2 TaxID=513052 RepID=B9BUI2_9BURK|nr:carboxymuconolactone decarboxylase family protein [Burkholderia multivorans]EEE05479.1 4-carboxymuconolactone decarboxylase [Burkholderia multivorans CGD2]EEE11751.1 4-carboxymuconolactone decarboxylase [Burkholderia multivorans CGD2M]MBU9399846.1 carboxymuconolactone decarboxylase family protein [Burkholderia multivorans]MBU9589910.1 carboxymuconolactone decarboxylase family protein [Burkholderia multivorans]
MPLSEQARINIGTLFPGVASTLPETDPELVEYFDNFAFDEVLRESRMDARTRLMLLLGALIASQARREYAVMLGAALTVGVTPVEVREVLYQAIPYVGMSKALDYIDVTNEALVAHGVTLPLPSQSTTTDADRFEKGLAVQRQIFGDVIDRMQASTPKDQQHIQRFLSANCFGDNYTRTGLDVPMRELLTFAMLIALGGCEPQVKGHIAGNLRVGNDRARLIDTVTQLLPFIGYPRSLNALRAIDEVVPAAGGDHD